MNILETSSRMLEQRPLCDHCLGRQFALLGHGIENDERGKSIKLALTLTAHQLALSKDKEGVKILKILATNGFFNTAERILQKMKKRVPSKNFPETCFLCKNKFENIGDLAEKALKNLEAYEFNTFLVGIELPLEVEEREDEFKADFNVSYGENMRNEFGRVIGKKIAERNGKTVDFQKPEIVVLTDPFSSEITLQINPLYVSGRYRKLVRGIPQSKWFCSNCRGKGCEKCNWTGKMYPESVEELIAKPLLDFTNGVKASLHASGREDIDARMLGKGRPFVIEAAKPQKRFLDLKKLEDAINTYAEGKVQVSNLQFADKSVVRKLKNSERAQKEYHVFIEFENKINVRDLRTLEEKLANALVKQKTPIRVLHRRADLTREKYIYAVKIKKVAPKKAEMKIQCQGGLYVKELVTGDEGRTTPSVSEILKNKAKPIKLDVLNIIMEN
ncbi:MAG TPA: tRNA pseudouridine(54/55) synthase Pus10 [Acidobacteriota bacterium]|jgi:tRNA pseudouridine synthase 10|nr:tRNA pseudouridine(54/55) synthase Pus10 [Acidobacteriota bacterium]